MVDAVGKLIDDGRLRLIAVDSIDWQSWTNQSVPPGDRAHRHEAYDRYVADELAPFMRSVTGFARSLDDGRQHGCLPRSQRPAAPPGPLRRDGGHVEAYIACGTSSATSSTRPCTSTAHSTYRDSKTRGTSIDCARRASPSSWARRIRGGDARGHPRARRPDASQGHPGHRGLLGLRRGPRLVMVAGDVALLPGASRGLG